MVKFGAGANVGVRNDKIDLKNDEDVKVDKIPVIRTKWYIL